MTEVKAKQILDVAIRCKAHSTGKMRNEIDVYGSWNPDNPWKLATDEGAFHGGDGTAPPPLALFAAGMTGCFMTQVRAFAKKLRIPLSSVSVNCSYKWQAIIPEGAPYIGMPVGFNIDIELDTTASFEEQKKLIDAAKKGCFIEQTLAQSNVIEHRLKVGEDWVDV